jgi:hypothetical protein
MEFSRALFLIDEIKCMIRHVALRGDDSQENLTEWYFWWNELYQTLTLKNKYKIWHEIEEVYYDLYALEHHLFRDFILKHKLLHMKQHKFSIVMRVLKNMLLLDSLSIDVLMLKMNYGNKKKLKYCKMDKSQVKEMFCEFLSTNKEIDLFQLVNSVKWEKLPKFQETSCKTSLLCCSLREMFKNKLENFEFECKNVSLSEINMVRSWNDVFKDVSIPTYRKLIHYVKYPINTTFTTYFKSNPRLKYSSSFKDEVWYNWENHHVKSALWNQRSREIRKKFPQEDDYIEQFSELYNYEIDEQPKWIQDYYALSNCEYSLKNIEDFKKEYSQYKL